MRLLTDNRAQSIQIGAVLLFGILIVLLATWQAFVIPDQNESIEFNHNQDVQQQMTELRTTVNSMPEAAATRSATVDLGVRYPSRAIFRNPPPVAGTIETLETEDETYAFSIENADPVDDNLGKLWDDTDATYNTGAIQYRPGYNEYRNAPRTIYEHSVLYNKFDREGSELTITDQSLIDGDRLTLVALNGSLSENRIDSTSVDFQPVSTQTRTVEIKPDSEDDDPITIEIPTRMRVEEWDSIVDGGHEVSPLDDEDDPFSDDDEIQTLQIELDDNRDSYRLQLAKVGVGNDATQTTAEYLSRVGESNGEYVVEVRDEFNRPIQGEDVTISLEEEQDEKSSDREGRVSYEPDGDGELVFSIGEEGKDQVTFEITTDEPEDSDVAGPETRDVVTSPENTVYQGLSFQLTATADSVGGSDQLRSGTPMQWIEWEAEGPEDYEGTIAIFDPDDSDRAETASTDIETESWETGEYDITVRAQDASGRVTSDEDAGSATIEVEEPPEEAFFTVDITETDSPVNSGETLEVSAEIENIGEESDEQNITLEIIDGVGEVDSESISLGPEDNPEEITLEWETGEGDAGDYDATVSSEDDSDSQQVTVEEPTGFFPTSSSVNRGTLTSFENMQNDDGNFAEMRGSSPDAFDIDIDTADVPAGTYELELGITDVDLQGGSNGISVTATDESGTQLISTTLTNDDSGTTVRITLDEIQSTQTITVQYSGDGQNDALDIDFQRLVEQS